MSVEEVIKKINTSIAALYTGNNDPKPIVCIVCDRFVPISDITYISTKQLKKQKQLLSPMPSFNLCEQLNEEYTLQKSIFLSTEDHCTLSECMLSPRATFVRHVDGRRNSGYTICIECKNSLKKKSMPIFCIRNNFAIGGTPPCLQELSAVELAVITPVKTFGYCFSYTGGLQKQLKGSLSYYKVPTDTIVRTGAQLEGLGLGNHVIILLYGSMTANQTKMVQSKYKVNTAKIVTAIKWLLQYNIHWRRYQLSYQQIVSSIKSPLVINRSRTVKPGEDNSAFRNVEHSETFQVFYPDGSVSTTTGGQENIEQFHEVVHEATIAGYDIHVKMSILSEAVRDYKDDNLVQAALLQFPYGIGGLNDKRFTQTSKISTLVDIEAYTTYLSMLSLPQFHKELFTLQLYNMQMKFKMMNSAMWKVRDKHFAEYISSELTCQDVGEAIENKRYGRDTPHSRGTALLGAIDAVCKAIPHTNEAAKVARRDMETMQHHFGCPTFFLTVTPDDDNHILIQIYSGTMLSPSTSVDNMSDSEIFDLSRRKSELRIEYPGICAYFFETTLQIVLKDVIGWDLKNKCPTSSSPGIFGQIKALSVSVEEQGRRTLHAHILLWELQLNETRTQLYTGSEHVVRGATNTIINKANDVCSTGFMFSDEVTQVTANMRQKAFPHPCAKNRHTQQTYPKVVDKQKLRELRCKRKHDNVFTFCPDCSTTWSSTDMVCSYLEHHVGVPNSGCDNNANTRRLKCKTTEFQLRAPNHAVIDKWIVDAAYNNHVHTASCFKHKFGVDKTSALCQECRYRYPQVKRKKTIIQDSSNITTPWYLWNGKKTERKLKEISLQRSAYNAFQNVCCPHISYSKLSCNTNISFLLPGPVAQYCVGYTMKNTQDDELLEYELVRAASQKILSKVKEDDTTHSVAIRRLIGTSFAHQSNNVVGAAMASYLTRNATRFHFSHNFSWCPLRDLNKLLHGEKINVNVSFTQHSAYFQCLALHYLCRPSELETISVFDFYTKYEVCSLTTNNKDNLLSFQNTRYFRHPSFNDKKKTFRQGVQPRPNPTLAKIFQYDFPDSATFQGDILHPDTIVNTAMEQYSQYVLLLFHPYRKKSDLLLHTSYTRKLQQQVLTGRLSTSVFTFLQNLQDTKSNNLRHVTVADELQRTTMAPSNIPTDAAVLFDEDNSSQADDQFLHLNGLAEQENELDEYVSTSANTQCNYNIIPSTFNCDHIRHIGGHHCGTSQLPAFSTLTFPDSNNFCINDTQPMTDVSAQHDPTPRPHPSQSTLVQILFAHNGRQTRSFADITGQHETVTVLKPNGSAKSIVDWAVQSQLDHNQRRAFEVIAASFVLSYYETALETRDGRGCCKAEMKKLRTLLHNNTWESNQLICFLHGPGGSGKSAVIDLSVLYSRSFCQYLWDDFQSHERVIVVTAMTGVAATLLQGETTHGALYLNQRKDITREQIQLWSQTKMVIIDEISFASKQDIAMIHTKLTKLKQQPFLRYGGINIVFCGDFRQLEPVGANKSPIYSESVPEFRDWINCYIELNGMWRFKNDIQWGELLHRIRNGNITASDVTTINNHLSQNATIPPTVRYATYFNKDRDSINTAIFEERLKSCFSTCGSSSGFLLIFSDNIYIQDSTKVYKHFTSPSFFWENFGENDIKMANGTGRMDPVLKLYNGCRVMLPTNINVASGQANGTQATVEKIVLKDGEHTNITSVSGIPVPSVFASQIHYVQLRHCNTRTQPQTFHVAPKNHSFKLKYRKMKATQVPILLNNATTGHKLQGSGVDELFVHNWSYVTNWVYVMLSRVKTLTGLYARNLLDLDLSKYALKPSYTRMLRQMRKKKPEHLTQQQYSTISLNTYSS